MDTELSRVVDALPGLMWTALPDGQIDFVNRRWCEYTGLGIDAARGNGWQTPIHPEDLPELLERWRATLATGEPREMQARLRRFDGAYRWFLFRASPLTDASGQLARWCGMNTDIEDRMQAEEALRGSERRFRSIVDGLPALVSLVTPGGEIEHANSTYLDYFGLTLDEAKGRMAGHSCHPDDVSVVLAAWRKSFDAGLPCDLENRRRRADGAYRWFRSRGFPLRDAEGRIVVWYFLQTDIDDAKRAEALLAGEKRLLEMVARGLPMPGILDALCQLVESAASGSHCSVVLVDASGTRLDHGAAPSLPASFIASINGRSVDADSGPCAMSVHLNEQVIAADIGSETRWAASAWCPWVRTRRRCWRVR